MIRGILDGGELWQHLTADVSLPTEPGPGMWELEVALEKIREIRPVETAVKRAVQEKRLEKHPAATLYERAEKEGIIDMVQLEQVQAAQEARRRAVTVDAFARGVTVEAP